MGASFRSLLKSPKQQKQQQQQQQQKDISVFPLERRVKISVSSCRIYVFGEAIKLVIFIRRLMECLLSLCLGLPSGEQSPLQKLP